MPVELLPALTMRPPRGGKVNVRYAKWCRASGLRSPSDFLKLEGDVISGHRDRHVVEVRVGGKRLYLKKEHRVSFRTRLQNWWAGYGLVSLSEREAATLAQLREVGVPVPEWIACGATSEGQAYLLLRNARGTDLRKVLARKRENLSRLRLAKSIGVAVGRLHQAGFDAPDLSAKHVLVRREGGIVLLDWPRARECRTLNRDRCLAALAGLHASLRPELATTRERMFALRAWMRTIGFHGPAAPVARQVNRLSVTLRKRRSIREQLQPARDPRLRWIDGETLCVTRRYWSSIGERISHSVRDAAYSVVPRQITVQPDPTTQLTCFPPMPRWRRLWGTVSQRPLQSEGIRVAGLAFRLARHRVPVMPVLAFGGRPDGGGFLLSRLPASMQLARSWFAFPRPGRDKMLGRVGRLLRQCHEAGCRGIAAEHLVIDTATRPRLRLIANPGLFAAAPPNDDAIATDLSCLARGIGLSNRKDIARVIRGYFSDNLPARRAA